MKRKWKLIVNKFTGPPLFLFEKRTVNQVKLVYSEAEVILNRRV